MLTALSQTNARPLPLSQTQPDRSAISSAQARNKLPLNFTQHPLLLILAQHARPCCHSFRARACLLAVLTSRCCSWLC
jgi:hypothetical protein